MCCFGSASITCLDWIRSHNRSSIELFSEHKEPSKCHSVDRCTLWICRKRTVAQCEDSYVMQCWCNRFQWYLIALHCTYLTIKICHTATHEYEFENIQLCCTRIIITCFFRNKTVEMKAQNNNMWRWECSRENQAGTAEFFYSFELLASSEPNDP